MIRRALLLLYLALVVLLSGGVAVVGEAVSEFGVTIEERQSQTKERVRQIITKRQERIEQGRQQVAEVAQIAHRWRVRAVQLARYIERQGLSVPVPTVPLRNLPPVQAESLELEPSEPRPSPDISVPTLEPLPSEPPPFVPPLDVLPELEATCIPIPSPIPDFCVPIPPTPTEPDPSVP